MSTADPWSALADDTLLKGLLERIDERLPPEQAQLVGAFVKVYLRRLPDEQFAQTPPEDVYAHVLSMFGFVDSRGTEPVAVRVFTPDRERDGYTTVGSVVEVSTDDAPFLVDSVVEEIQSHGLGVHRLIHPVIGTDRGPDGRIRHVVHAREAVTHESAMHYELDRRLSSADQEDLRAAILRVLHDVRLADSVATIRFWRDARGDSHAEVLRSRGRFRLVQQPPPESLTATVRERFGALVDTLRR